MRSLTLKLTLAFLLVGLIGSALVAVLLRQETRSAFDQFLLNREQQALVNSLVQYYQANGSWQDVAAALQPLAGSAARLPGDDRDFRHEWMGFTLVDAGRVVVFSVQAGQTGRQLSSRDLGRAIPLSVDGKQAGWLLLSPVERQWVASSPEGLFLKNINRATLISALLAAALAVIAGGVLAFSMTRSLRELTEATVQIARGKLGLQVKVRSKDELGQLSSAFNQMSSDLAQATETRQRMTADIAHDLRSPLSVISGYAEALSDGKLPGTPEIYAILHQETRHLSRLIDDLRTLSLADSGELGLSVQPAEPQSLLEWVAARHTVQARQKGIELRVQSEAGLPKVMVDVERMAQVLDNLIVNAFRYTPAGGTVTLSAEAGRAAVLLRVADNGSGIAPEDLPHIFDRFYRADRSRQQSGESGLGLAIARSIVAAHSGSLTVESTPGQGAVFTISLPLAPAGA